MERILEPEIMDGILQVEEFDSANRDYSIKSIVYWFEKMIPIRTGTIVDIGCGTCKLDIELCKRFPGLSILGIDGSSNMIELAKKNISENKLNINVKHEMFNNLILDPHECVISIGTLHHVHDHKIFWETIKRITRPGSYVFVSDILRPKDLTDVEIIIENLIPDSTLVWKQDFKNSLCAAYSLAEIKEQLDIHDINLSINIQKNNIGEMIIIHGRL